MQARKLRSSRPRSVCNSPANWKGEGGSGESLQREPQGRSRAPLFPVRKTMLGSRRVRVYTISYARRKPKQEPEVRVGKQLETNESGVSDETEYGIVSQLTSHNETKSHVSLISGWLAGGGTGVSSVRRAGAPAAPTWSLPRLARDT